VLETSIRPARVLVIEDDPNVSEVVARYLAREGYRVETAADGAQGLRRALEELPDLVVLDLMLPGLNGIEVCRQLRAVAPVPVIMLTARGEERDRISGLELGADDYVAKPFSPRELTARARAVLRRANGSMALAATDGGHRDRPVESRRVVQRAPGGPDRPGV
jgi:two-component system response regulator ResD